MPKRCLWLLLRTIRHQPDTADALAELTVYGIDCPSGLIELLAACPAVKRISVRSSRNDKALKASWEPLFDALEQRSLLSLDWHGPDGSISGRTSAGKGVTRALAWHGLEELSVSEEFFSILDPILVPPSDSPTPTPATSLTYFSLERASVPYNLLDRLHPLLPSLTSLSIHTIHGLCTADLSRALVLLGPTLTSLSLLGSSTSLWATSKLTLSSLSLSTLSSLTSLTLSGTSAPLDLFETLPSHVRTLSLDPGEELEPAWVVAGLRHLLRSDGLETLSIRLRDLGEEWEEERIQGWWEWRERIEAAGRSGGKSVRVEFVDRRESR